MEHTSSSTATTWALLRDGGMDVAGTGKPTSSSGAYTSCHTSKAAQYTHVMFSASRTQPTNHLGASMPQHTFSSLILRFPRRLPPTSSTLTTPLSALGRLLDASESQRKVSSTQKTLSKSSSNTDGKLRNLPLPVIPATAKKRPSPYPKNLALTPSILRPHCMAKDRLHEWLPLNVQRQDAQSRDSLPLDDQRRVAEVMMRAWEEDTRETYGSGLLVYHVFCDSKGTPEAERAPASQPLLSAFATGCLVFRKDNLKLPQWCSSMAFAAWADVASRESGDGYHAPRSREVDTHHFKEEAASTVHPRLHGSCAAPAES